jgi:hypothetical protein
VQAYRDIFAALAHGLDGQMTFVRFSSSKSPETQSGIDARIAQELVSISKLLSAGYRPYKNMRGDPMWMKSKYPGVAIDGTPFNKGDDVLYWPRMPKGKNIMVGEQADREWAQFESSAADEEFMSRDY